LLGRIAAIAAANRTPTAACALDSAQKQDIQPQPQPLNTTPTPTPSDPAVDVSLFREAGGQILVGTPGRLDDVMKRCGDMDTRRLEVGEWLAG